MLPKVCFTILKERVEPQNCSGAGSSRGKIDWKTIRMKVELDRSQCDYVYLTQIWLNWRVENITGKRNHIKQFQEKYSYHIPLWLLNGFHNVSNWRRSGAIFDIVKPVQVCLMKSFAIKEAFTHFEELGLKGRSDSDQWKSGGVYIGDPLNPETVVIHIEKAIQLMRDFIYDQSGPF